VTAAAKHEQPIGKAPSSATVITREEILRFGYRTLAEALAAQRSFYKSYDRTYEYIGVRGFLRPGDYNDRIVVQVNGHRYNDDIFFSPGLGPSFGIDMEDIERIEVIRGPGSALHGGNALFAVVNVVTVDPSDVPRVQLLGEMGSFERKRGKLAVAHEFTNGLELYATMSGSHIDGRDELYYREFDRPETNNGVAEDADEDWWINSFLSARYSDFYFQAGHQTREKEDPTAAYGVKFNEDDTYNRDSRSFAELSFNRAVHPRLDLTARAYYDSYYYKGNFVYGWFDNIDEAYSNWFGGEIDARFSLFPGNTLSGGVAYQYHPHVVQKNFDDVPFFSYLDDRRAYNNWGVYLQDEWALLPNLDLVAGVRFDQYYNDIQEFTPRGALIWRPLERTTVKLLIGQAFRPPNLFELRYAAPGDPALLANPNLDAEKNTTYEAVFEHTLSNGASGLISLYYYDIDDLIENTRVGNDIQFKNLDTVEAQGVEFEVRVPFRDRFFFRGSYGLQEARVDGDQLLSNSPKHLGQVSLRFPLPMGVEGGVEYLVVGPRPTLGGGTVDTAQLVNLTVRLPSIHGFRLTGSVYNLADQEFHDPAGPEQDQDRLRQDGRTWRVQLLYAF
jgi:iron complex outermembrane receptor protein